MKRFHVAIVAVVLVTACPGRVFAHAVGVSCMIRGDKVEVEAYYDDDSPAISAVVQVLDAQEQIVATGITDEKGQWFFARPAPGTYVVKLDAGAGHRAKAKLIVPGVAPEPPPRTMTPKVDAVSERARFTQFPWVNVSIGLALIGGGCGAVWIVSKLRRKGPRHEPTQM